MKDFFSRFFSGVCKIAGWGLVSIVIILVVALAGMSFVYRSWIDPSRDYDWSVGQSHVSSFSGSGCVGVLSNVRNIDPRIPHQEVYKSRLLDCRDIVGVRLYTVLFDKPRTLFSHLMMGFVMRDGRELVLSVEARKIGYDTYHPAQGLVGGYGLIFVRSDARDVVGLRRLRGDNIIVDTINNDVDYSHVMTTLLSETNQLASSPRRYHSITDNCTTALHDALVKYDNRLGFTLSTIFSSSYRDYLAHYSFF